MALPKVNYGPPPSSSALSDNSASISGGLIAPRPSPLEARAAKVEVTKDRLIVDLVDGRRLETPISWFPRLIEASERERAEFVLLGDGEMIHWPAVDEDIDVPNLLR